MKALLTILTFAFISTAWAAEKPSVFDLLGNWEATVDVGKFKLRVVTKLVKSPEGKMIAKIDVPEQGAKDIPVNAMFFNYPAVRWEIDQFGTAFNGTVSAETNQIAGTFEEGPGGKPMSVVFKRARIVEEPKRVYTFAAGEPRDIRGYWKATLQPSSTDSLRVGLKIGRAADGSFGVLLDLLDHGAREIPASSVMVTNANVKLQWQLADIVFEGTLDSGGDKLAGSWKQRGRSSPATFERLDEPATALPANLSFTPDPNSPDDIRGYWKGALDAGGQKLNLLFKIGKTPEGVVSGSLVSIDQAGVELPMTSGSLSNRIVQLEWKGIRGVFKGPLNQEGNLMDGTWEQGGPPLTLKMERVSALDTPASR